MAKKIMIGLKEVGEINGSQTRRRMLQKAKAYCREDGDHKQLVVKKDQLFVTENKKYGYQVNPVWVFDTTDTRTLQSEGYKVSSDWGNDRNECYDKVTRIFCEMGGKKVLIYWRLGNYQSSREIENRVKNNPIFLQALIQGCTLYSR